MHKVKALFFDVGGTVFDWKNTARKKIQALADEKGQAIDSKAFAVDWRGEMMRVHTQVRYGRVPEEDNLDEGFRYPYRPSWAYGLPGLDQQ